MREKGKGGPGMERDQWLLSGEGATAGLHSLIIIKTDD
jgi:hypothetical protein